MKSIQMTTACALILMLSTVPVRAENLVQAWNPFGGILVDSIGCLGEDGFAQGMVHTVISNLRQGGVLIHFNAQGTVTGLVTGNEWLWRDSWNETLPIFDGTFDDVVFTEQRRLKIIGPAHLPSLFINIEFHATIVDSEIKVFTGSTMPTLECSG